MKANETPLRHSRLSFCSFVISVISLLVGGLVVLGWLFDIGYLKSIVPDFVTMKVNTAVGFILAGIALWAFHTKAPIPKPRLVGQICAALICLIGLLTLLEYLLQKNLGIDELLWQQPTEALISAAPGRMSAVTALTFFLLGIALLLLNLDKAWGIAGAQIIAVVTAIIPLIGLIGYSYNIEPLYHISAFTSMALNTAITAELLCLGVLFARPGQGLMASVTSPNSGGVMARRVLPFVVLLPILIGWLRLAGQRAEYYDTIFGVVLLVISFIISFVTILWFNAHALNRMDTAREQVEKEKEETEERFRIMADTAPVMVWISDLDKRCYWFNKPWLAFTGRTMDQEIGNGWTQGVHPEDYDRCLATYLDSFDARQPFSMEYRLRRHDGEYRWILDNGIPRYLPDGGFAGYIGSCLDITERKQMEQDVQESEERFRTLVEQASDAFFVHDMNGRFLDVNQQACESLGYQREELLQMSVFDIEQDYNLEEARQVWPQVCPGRAATLYGHHRRQDGTSFPVEVRWSCFDLRGQRLFLALVRDITERKRAEEALRESEARHRAVTETASDAIITIDATSTIIFANQAAQRIFGYAREEMLGQPLTMLIPAHLEQQHQTSFQRYVITQQRHISWERLQLPGLHKTGQEIPLEISFGEFTRGGQLFFTGIMRDITERERVEAALRQSEEHFRAIFEGAGVGNVECDAMTGRFLFVNRKFCEITGYSREELLTLSFREITHPADRELNFAHYRQFVKGEVANYAVEKRYLRKDDSIVWVQVTSTCLLNTDGQPWRTIAVVQDITERKRAEEEVQQLNADLEKRVIARTEELAAANREMEAFSYSVSHDLRAPLRAIDGFSRILVEEYMPQLPAEAFDYLQLVRDNTQQMGKLIDDLLGFSRLNRHDLRKQLTSPTVIVHQALSQLQHEQAGRRIKITIDDMPDCLADPALLKQVFINLLSNALKFTSRCEEAVISVGCLPRAESGAPPIYFVKDNGVGFDMKYSHKLFNVFQRLHRAEDYEGTGVGLATVQRIIQRHGGRIWAEAALNQGATFFFTLEGDTSA